ncbi:hypothetical protein SLEP1_g38040, partial [Rubroshorea leprosula]
HTPLPPGSKLLKLGFGVSRPLPSGLLVGSGASLPFFLFASSLRTVFFDQSDWGAITWCFS